MREVRYSTTFIHQLNTLLAQGEAKFGVRVADRKRDLVYDTIDNYLAQFPKKPRDPGIVHGHAAAPASILPALSGSIGGKAHGHRCLQGTYPVAKFNHR